MLSKNRQGAYKQCAKRKNTFFHIRIVVNFSHITNILTSSPQSYNFFFEKANIFAKKNNFLVILVNFVPFVSDIESEPSHNQQHVKKAKKRNKRKFNKKQLLREVYVVNEEAVEAVVILPANLEYLGKILAGEVEYKMIPLATFDIRDIDIVIRRAIYNREDLNLAVSQRIDTDVQVGKPVISVSANSQPNIPVAFGA